MTIKEDAIKVYTPPFVYEQGYIHDSKGSTVADRLTIARLRGWGRIKGMENSEDIHDAIGEHIAAALTEYWEKMTK